MFIETDYEKDFEKEDVVSIWLARFESPEELENYMAEHKDENDSSFSEFYLEFRMGYLDHDFIDFVAQPAPVKSPDELFRGASYGKSIVEEIRKSGRSADLNKYNAFICVYDFAFVPDADYVRKNQHIDYWGFVAYDRNNSGIFE